MKNDNKCLVVFSGGQDSTTCLHWAQQKFSKAEAVFFDYGQRHLREKSAARTICRRLDIPLTVLKINTFAQIGGNALVDASVKIRQNPSGLPSTFVPGRNLIFLTYAASLAYGKGIHHLVTGVCETDYSGYPDCRNNTLKSLQKTLSLGMAYPIAIHAPLMHRTKAATVRLAKKVGALESLAYSHTCYQGSFPPCGKCPACRLRAKGFREAGIEDPLLVRANRARRKRNKVTGNTP